jgi:N-acetylmuramoyl-L-alanine amidase
MTEPGFAADSRLVDEVAPSPNHGERRGVVRPDMIVLHYTGMATADVALQRLCEAGGEVSAHYFVCEDGRLVQCVSEARRAWHAGDSCWAGETDINSRSIGIEIVNPGHGLAYGDFPDAQIATVMALCRDILERRPIPAVRILGHSDVAPARKQDPGEKFPWPRLAAAGIGHWVAPAPIFGAGPVLTPGDEGAEVRELQRQLADYGYGLEATGRYDVPTEMVVTAFQRHFRPARIDGVADASTMKTLAALLATRPA